MRLRDFVGNTRLSHWWWWIGVCAVAVLGFNPSVGFATFSLVIVGFTFLFASVYTLNNTYDHQSDKWNPEKNNPVAHEKISYRESVVQTFVLAGVGLAFLGVVSTSGLISGLVLTLLNVAYHVPPLRTKSRPYLDIMSITLLYATPFFVGYSAVNGFDLRGMGIAVLFGLLSGMVHPFQTAKDLDQDRMNGDNTIAASIGLKRSVMLSLILVVATLLYFELLVTARFIDPKMILYPLTFIPSLAYYVKTISDPSHKKIDSTVLILRLNGIIGGIVPVYLLLR
jgi:4-hydroxybenzoate polyprenyltransferase